MTENQIAGRSLSRRRFMEASAIGVLALASGTACDALSTQPKQKGAAGDSPGQVGAKEAPTLKSRVDKGEIPPLKDRLPVSPLVVKPVESAGDYGGAWRMGITGGSGSLSQLNRFQGYEGLVRWTPDWSPSPIPNVAEAFEIGGGGRSYTFKLRKGMKWSDGKPFTADDILFWYEDVVRNTEITPVPPSWMVVGGKLGTVTKVDDLSVRFDFTQPHGLFLAQLAQPGADAPVRYAKHYLSQFHKKYNDRIDDLVKENNLSDWVQLFQNKGGSDEDSVRYGIKSQPLLHPWIFTSPPRGGSSHAIAERNPYYWKVDPQGRQLPYLDRVEYNFLQGDNTNTLTLMVLGGEIDMEDQFFATPENKSVIADGMEKGDYRLYATSPTEANEAVIQLNLTHKDPVKRQIFQNKDFRIGLSHALDRQEIIDLVLLRQGKPWQAAPRPESEYYNERLATQYTEYDVAKANQHLDKAGFTERDGGGFRTGPDGKRISIGIDLDSGRPIFVDMVQMVKDYWEAVGIHVSITSMERSLWEERVRDNADFDATIHRFGGGSGEAVVLDPRYYFPSSGNSMYAAAWQAWYNDLSGEDASAGVEKPPAAAQRQMTLYRQLLLTPDAAQRKDLMAQILQIAAEEFYVIGISLQANGYGVVRNNFHNVPKTMPASYIYPNPAPSNPEQFFIRT
ncbi:ABC transporter substrate-binding protein [Actinopolymorpha pittospori]